MKMNKEDEIALEESISDWKKKAKGITITRKCPLCTLGMQRNGDDSCSQCIIKRHTGVSQCCGTPFWPRGTTLRYYQREIEFLESLRPKKEKEKDIIEVGDEVLISDPSYLLRLNKGRIGDRNDAGFSPMDRIYVVLEVNSKLPEGSKNRGQFCNNTILYEPNTGEYIFIHREFLKLIKPKHCPECGKAE